MVGDTPILAHLNTRPILGRGTVQLAVSSDAVRLV